MLLFGLYRCKKVLQQLFVGLFKLVYVDPLYVIFNGLPH